MLVPNFSGDITGEYKEVAVIWPSMKSDQLKMGHNFLSFFRFTGFGVPPASCRHMRYLANGPRAARYLGLGVSILPFSEKLNLNDTNFRNKSRGSASP